MICSDFTDFVLGAITQHNHDIYNWKLMADMESYHNVPVILIGKTKRTNLHYEDTALVVSLYHVSHSDVSCLYMSSCSAFSMSGS